MAVKLFKTIMKTVYHCPACNAGEEYMVRLQKNDEGAHIHCSNCGYPLTYKNIDQSYPEGVGFRPRTPGPEFEDHSDDRD